MNDSKTEAAEEVRAFLDWLVTMDGPTGARDRRTVTLGDVLFRAHHANDAFAELMRPHCSLCDKTVEILPSGAMIHPDGTGHEEWDEDLAAAGVEWTAR